MLISQIGFTLLACVAQNACDLPPKAVLAIPRSEYHGVYINDAYRYAVQIPDELSGYDQPTPPHHGFGLAIGSPARSYIFVNGEANSLEHRTPDEAATQLVEYLRQDGSKIESKTVKPTHLGILNAVLLVVRYRCPESTRQYVRTSVAALSPDKSTVYEISLYAPVEHSDEDSVILDAMVKSWKYTKNEDKPVQ